jgi:hypothetical protein
MSAVENYSGRFLAAVEASAPAYRTPPHNIEAEQALIGAVLVNNDAFDRVSDFLKADHFSEELHRRIFEIASQLIRAGKVATPVTLKTFLGEHDLGGMTVPQYLARLAAEAGREVMAIPGSPLDPRSRGCNQLIREGATLVQNASEIAELLSPLDSRMLVPPVQHKPSIPLMANDSSQSERNAVINLMGMTYVSVDELVRQSGSSQANVQMVLLEIELAGKLERGAGGKVRLAT